MVVKDYLAIHKDYVENDGIGKLVVHMRNLVFDFKMVVLSLVMQMWRLGQDVRKMFKRGLNEV